MEINTKGLLEKTQERLRAAKKYSDADGRKESRERLYEKLKGHYYSPEVISDGRDRIKVETIAGLTYQMRPVYHFRRPHLSIEAKTPDFITQFKGQKKTINNVTNAQMMEIAINQEFHEIQVEEEVNAAIQDWLCPYPFGALKVGYGDRSLFSSWDIDKVNTEGIWILRACPSDILVDHQARGRRSIGHYFNRIYKPLQWVKDNKNFTKARQNVAPSRMPDYLRDRDQDGGPRSYDMAVIYEFHDLETGQMAVLDETSNDWLIPPYKFPYEYRGSQFVFLNPMPLNDDFYGRCYTSLAEPQVDEANKYRTRLLRIFKRWPVVNFYNTGAWTDEQQQKWQDSDDAENIEVVNKDNIETRAMPALPADLWRTIELMERDTEKVLGTSAMRRGEVKNVKPTTAQIIEGHGNIRDADVREEVAKVYQSLASKGGDLMIQFYDKPRWVRLTGGAIAPPSITQESREDFNFALYSNEDIIGNYDFKADVSSMSPVNNEMKSRVLMETLKGLPSLPPDVVENFRRKYDISELLYDIVKMQGVDLKKYERNQEEENENDPWNENEIVMGGGTLRDPGPNEKHKFHSEVHGKIAQLLSVNPQDPRFIEIARHDQMHKAEIAKQEGLEPPQQPSPGGGNMGPIMGPGGMPPPVGPMLPPV